MADVHSDAERVHVSYRLPPKRRQPVVHRLERSAAERRADVVAEPHDPHALAREVVDRGQVALVHAGGLE
jgi:hypothetical protein